MTGFTFTVGSSPQSIAGSLNWNANGTLRSLAITDGFNSGGTQTCTYGTSSVMGYDDLGRLLNVNCGSAWNQTFSYDQFGNISKTGSLTWACAGCYNGNNQYNSTLSSSISYDLSGNLLNDTFYQYTWDAYGHTSTIASETGTVNCGSTGTCVTYDALGRMVEQSVGSKYTEILYSPIGKTGTMSGTATSSIYFPLPAGATYYASGSTGSNRFFWHKDWQGSARFGSTLGNRSSAFDRAFAPFGETYNNFGGTTQLSFTGDTQDTASGMYDTPNRELYPNQGRWISPDPAGLGAVDISNPQTWNRYAYVQNNPLNSVDPTGLENYVPWLQNLGYSANFSGTAGFGNCDLDGIDTPCSAVYAALQGNGAVQCPNNDCSIFRQTFTGSTGGNFSLVAAANGLLWINNYNGEGLSDAGAAEAGLNNPVSLQSLPDDPNNLRLITRTDYCRGKERTIEYWLEQKGGALASGSWAITEQIQSNVTTNSGGTGSFANKFTDWLSQAGEPNPYNAIQNFTISINGSTFPVLVNIGGQDFGKLGLWISHNPLRNGQPSPHPCS